MPQASTPPVDAISISDDENFADASDSLNESPTANQQQQLLVNGDQQRSASTQSDNQPAQGNDLNALFEQSWQAVELLRTKGIAATASDHWSPTFYAPRRRRPGNEHPRAAKRRDSDQPERRGNAGANTSSAQYDHRATHQHESPDETRAIQPRQVRISVHNQE